MLQPGPIRQEIDAILRGCLAETEELLRQKAHCVEVLRDYLLVEEQVTGDRFAQIMEALGEPKGGEEAAVRRPPKVLAPHRPVPAPAEPTGNGHAGVPVGAPAEDRAGPDADGPPAEPNGRRGQHEGPPDPGPDADPDAG